MPTLKDLRLRKFLTQKQLAYATGIPYQTVQRWEVGTSRPRPSNMHKLSEAFGVDGEELLAAIQSSAASSPEADTPL